jgi:hypothetical protein
LHALQQLAACCSPAVMPQPQALALRTASGRWQKTITFKIDSEFVFTSGWNISRFDMGQGVRLNITSNMHQDKRTISFNINGWKTGRYSLYSGARDAGTAYGDYKPAYNDMLNSFQFEDGEIHIEKIDIDKGLVNASFFGTLTNGREKHSISDGRIVNGKLRSGITKY